MGTHKRFDNDDEQVPLTKQISKPQPRHLRKPRQHKSLRGQIRSIERLIKNRGTQLAPSALTAKRRELGELLRLRDEHDRRENERKVAKEYRMLKFFEKRKLERVLDRILAHGDKSEDAERKARILRDLTYINEYPKDKKYVSLFPTGGHTDRSRAKVDAIRAEIEGCGNPPSVGYGTAKGEPTVERKGDDLTPVDDQASAEKQDDFFLEEE